MRIGIIVSEFPVLSETFILSQVAGLLDMGHTVDVYAFNRPQGVVVSHEVARYGLLEGRLTYLKELTLLRGARRIVRLLGLLIRHGLRRPAALARWGRMVAGEGWAESSRRLILVTPFWAGRYDIILCHFGVNGRAFLFLEELTDAKYVCVFHGYDLSRYVRENGPAVYRALFQRGDLFLPVSERWKVRLLELGCSKEKVVVHHMGVDLAQFRAVIGERSGDTVRLLSVARFVEKKGLEYALQAVATMMTRYPKLRYDIVGSGPMEPSLRALIRTLGLEGRVALLGPQSQGEVARLMAAADIFLLPSVTAGNGDQEGIPVSIMEAMACGMPVISTRHSGIPELVEDGASGFLVPERDVEALAEKLRFLIERPELRRAFGARGRRIVEQQYNLATLTKALERLCLTLLGRQRMESRAVSRPITISAQDEGAGTAAASIRGSGAPPDMTVIIATRNRAGNLRQTLETLAGQETNGAFTYEILVIDNGSTDETRQVVEGLQPTFPVLLHYVYEGRAGKPWALNTGMRVARGAIFAFTDDDILVGERWLLAYWLCFAEEQADGVTGRILPRWTSERPAWLTDEAFRQIGGMGCIDWGQTRLSSTQHDCRWVGGNMAIRRDVVQRIGGYDTRLVRAQDTEYYCRCIDHGLAVVYEPAALVYHKIRAERMTPQSFRRWRHMTGYYHAYLLPWHKTHLLTIMPLWRYQRTWQLLSIWLKRTLRGSPWWERFHFELLLREDLTIWRRRIQLWPRWCLTVLTGRSYMP